MNLPAWLTLKQIIDSQSLAEGDGADPGQFMRKLNFAIKAYTDMHLRRLPATTPVTLTIDPELRVAPLPRDCMAVVGVGMVCAGQYIPFIPSSDRVNLTSEDCGVDSQQQVVYETEPPARKCYYTVELTNRRVVIDAPLTITEVVVNYTPTGVSMDGITYVPRICAPVIEAYIDWQMVLRDRTVNIGEKKNLEMEYYRQCAIFQGLQYNVDELFNEYYNHIVTGKQY